jgi:cytochrome c oxidase accessory protein FixG
MSNIPLTSTESFRDRVATIDEKGDRVWIFPQKPSGKKHTWRVALSILYLGLLFGLPWVKVAGHPLFLFDVIHRKFILFGQIFWPQDFFIFALGMLLFIVFVALFTVVFGRVFCGWMCPQTIFMEMVFRKIEYWIEGDAPRQKMLDKQPWNREKILKKSSKWLAFWVLSFIIANTFLAYIVGTDQLVKIITEPVMQHLGGFIAIIIFTIAFFFVYLRFREQVCTVVCPYGRLQGVLLDKDSIVVAYDYVRGEQRGKFKKNEEREIGDCIDCNQCVKVCPTGIDIRNGTQLECINCTACIDACNYMMDAVGLPRDLIRYDSENGIKDKKPMRFTARMKAYSLVMLLLLGAETYLLATRSDIGVSMLRAAGQLFQEQPGGKLSNLYNYKLINKTYFDKQVSFRPENFKGEIRFVGKSELNIPKEGDAGGGLFIILDKADVHKRKTELKIGVYEGSKKIQTVSTSFLGPFKAD